MNDKFLYIDLFAGMGGFRRALDAVGGRCVYSSEINPACCETYKNNFGDQPDGDITKVDESSIPDHHLLAGGFPCQSFSIAGKKMGFADPRGTLFFDILRIADTKRPKALLLENVKNLSIHDSGRTLTTIKKSLEQIGYHFSWEVLNAKDFGVPQNRERTIMVASLATKFDINPLKNLKVPQKNIRDILAKKPAQILDPSEYTLIPERMWKKQKSGLLFVGYRNKPSRTTGTRPSTEHLSRFHKQPNRVYHADGTHPTIPSQEPSGRFWVYDGQVVRRLSHLECLALQGFPPTHLMPSRTSEAYRQIGNSVPPPLIEAVVKMAVEQQVL